MSRGESLQTLVPPRRLPRLLAAFLFFLLSSLLPAQNALILIQHDQAGPNLPTPDYIHAEWILWPNTEPGRNNRVLSLATGFDLRGEESDERFKPVPGGWVSGNGLSLEARGVFAARAAHLGPVETTVVQKEKGGLSPSLLLLALKEPSQTIQPQPFDGAFPNSGLVVYEAGKWDDAMAVAKRATGRTLIVEYPPAGNDGWSRYWLRGAWPPGVPTDKGLGVPGLIRARRAMAMLLRPNEFDWRPDQAGRWGGANRWLEHGRTTSTGVLLAWFLLATFVLAWALAQVMNEDRGPFVSELLVWVALSPAAIVLTGAAGRLGGLEAWPIVLALTSVGLYGASLLLGLATRRLEAHPLWASCAVGFLAMAFCDPLWSDFSGRFGPLDLDVPGEALGAFAAYLTGVIVLAPGRWPGRALVAALLLWGVTARPWWVDGHAAMLVVPAIALVAAEGRFRPIALLVLALLPTGIMRIVREGVVWNAGGLLASADESRAPNFWLNAVLLVSPAWIGGMIVLGAGLLVGNRFLAYRLRKLLRLDPRLRALPWATAAILALGVTEPLVLPAVPVLAFGALIALAYDGLRANA